MILIIESLATQGLLFFMAIVESLYHSLTKKDCLFKSKAVLEKTPLWGLPTTVIDNNEFQNESNYQPSILTAEQSNFFQAFLGIENKEMDDCIIEPTPIDSDILTMEDWNEQTPPVSVTPKLAATADAKISDYLIGKQLWVAEVVGEEQGFLHVSDGSGRAWVEASRFSLIGKGDILSLLIERDSLEDIYALEIDILQKYSTDFSVDCDFQEEQETTWAIA